MFGIVPNPKKPSDPHDGEWELALLSDGEVWLTENLAAAVQTARQEEESWWNPKHQPVNPYHKDCRVVRVRLKKVMHDD